MAIDKEEQQMRKLQDAISINIQDLFPQTYHNKKIYNNIINNFRIFSNHTPYLSSVSFRSSGVDQTNTYLSSQSQVRNQYYSQGEVNGNNNAIDLTDICSSNTVKMVPNFILLLNSFQQ